MKKLWCLILSAVLLACLGLPAVAETELADYYCAEEGFTTKVPVSGSAGYSEGNGLQIYLDVPGYPPRVLVSRRPVEMKFSNPENFLNNVFREYMEETHGDDSLGMNPAKIYEIGGKTLLGARYMYKAAGYNFVLLRLIEVRDDGDVEYTAVYQDGAEDTVADALDAAVRYYQPDGAEALEPVNTEQTQEPEKTESTSEPEKTETVSSGLLVPDAIPADTDPDNGVFWARIPDPEKILDGGYFTVMLYLEDLYPAAAIESLKEGDQVLVNGRALTVQSMVPHDDGNLEMIPVEEIWGYIAFKPYSDTHYSAMVNDCTLVSHVADKKYMMPLPNDFSFSYVASGDDISLYDADGFVDHAKDGYLHFTEFNTTVIMQNGLVMSIVHADYPDVLEDWGPGETEFVEGL